MKVRSIFKKLAAVAFIASACSAASAAETNLGLLPLGTTNFNNSGFPTVGPAFADVLFFALPANGGSTYGVIDFPLDLSAAVSGLVFGSLFSFVSVSSAGPDGLFMTPDDVIHAAGGIVNPVAPSFSFNMPASDGGGFYLFVSGMASAGAIGSLYSGSITVTPVPEPESFAMLLAGLGVMGAIAVRRNKAKKQS